MDDTWQKHKTFIVTCVVMGLVFLIAWMVSSDDDIAKHQKSANTIKTAITSSNAPDRASITAQQKEAVQAEKNISSLAARVASTKVGDAYVREHLDWGLANVGLANQSDRFFGRYKDLPQTCLGSLRDAMSGALAARAAREGKEIDESLGLNSGFEDAEVKYGIHALAIVSDIVQRCLDMEGIDAVEKITISPRPRRRVGSARQDGARANAFSVSMQVRGDPDQVNALIRSFNQPAKHMNRLTVLDSVDFIQRIRNEDDTVKASFNLFGIQYRGIGQEGEGQ